MPYKEKGKWRGKVYSHGKRYTKRCKSKQEALSWESQKRKELKELHKVTPTVSLLKVATEYLEYCEKHFSYSTFSDKRKAIRELMAVIGEIDITQVKPNIILHDILMKQNTPYLYNKRRKDLHAFFEYCRDFHGLQINPITPTKKVPMERTPQPVPTEEEFLRLLMVADRHDKNLLVALGATGGRRSEVFRWTWTDDINFKEGKVRLGNRKNRAREMRYRWIEMNDELFEALQDQYKTRLPHSDYVFQNRDPRSPHYGKRYVARRRFMKGLCKRAGVDKPIGFHALRRFFASLLADHREKLPTIQKLLGHANVSQTDRYVQHLKDDTAAAIAKISFRELAHKIGTKKEEAGDEDR